MINALGVSAESHKFFSINLTLKQQYFLNISETYNTFYLSYTNVINNLVKLNKLMLSTSTTLQLLWLWLYIKVNADKPSNYDDAHKTIHVYFKCNKLARICMFLDFTILLFNKKHVDKKTKTQNIMSTICTITTMHWHYSTVLVQCQTEAVVPSLRALHSSDRN